MALLTLRDNTLCIDGSGFIELDRAVAPETLLRAIQAQDEAMLQLPAIYPACSKGTQAIIAETAAQDPYLGTWFSDLQHHFSSVATSDGVWDETSLQFCWCCILPLEDLKEVMLEHDGRMFLRHQDNRLSTLQEYAYYHGEDVANTIRKHIQHMNAILDDFLRIRQGGVRTLTVPVITAHNEVTNVNWHGPAAIPVKLWPEPEGYTLLSDKPID